MSPILSLRIDNFPSELKRFAVPGMNLSSARADMTRHTFVFTIDTKMMVEFLEPAYADWVEESKRDDDVYGGPQDALARAGYPDLVMLVESPELLQLVLGYLQRDFLGKLTWDGASQIEYWLDDVTNCDANDEHVRLSGICYSKR